MTYTTLANKWRPKTLDDIVGQEETIYTVKNIIKSKKIPQSYIISGTSGIGKTSLARIIIKCINCKIDITIKPCNKCICCTSINNGQNTDSIEIDAASKTKVEELKELINLSQYKNTTNRFKTYIIDECHMLSVNSFNSLLKILEEPDNNTIYILITTHIEKIPITIISRCVHLKLRKISNQKLKEKLLSVLITEKITYEAEALDKIIYLAQGNLRQALNIVEKLNTNITNKNITSMLGLTNDEYILLILKYLYEDNIKELIKNTHNLIENYNIDNILIQIHLILYKLILYKLKIIYDKKISLNTIFIYLSTKLSKEIIQELYKIISEEKEHIKFAPNTSIGFEMLLIKALIKIQNLIKKS